MKNKELNFESTKAFISEKLEQLKFPYFKCVVRKEGKEVFTYKFTKEKVHNDLLCLYSLSKPITVVALLQLVDKGLVNVDDKVSKYLEGYDSKESSKITVHNLLTMTSGLDYNFSRKAIVDLLKNKPNANTIDIASKFALDGLCFSPGKDFNYSLSMDVCAAIVEKASGEKFSSYVKNHIFKPLKIRNLTFKNNLALAKKARDEYRVDENNNLIKAEKYYKFHLFNSNYESGGAGLIGTINDYALFIDSLANSNEKILKASLLEKMSKVYVQNPPFEKIAKEYSIKHDQYGYGYGVRVRKVKSTNNIPIGEFGWDGATGSYCLCDRKNKISIVIALTIQAWPTYIKQFHVELADKIYKDLKIK